MRVLIVTQVVPFPPAGGDELRTFHLARALARRHEVTLVGFRCRDAAAPPPFPVRVHEHPWEMPPLWRDMADGRPAVWQPAYEALLERTEEPWFVSCMESAGMSALIRRVARQGFDLAVVHHTNMARFLPDLPPHVPTVLNLHRVHTLMARREVPRSSGEERPLALREADRTLRFERRAAARCALCLTASEPEAAAARRLLGIDHVQVVPNGVDTTRFAPGARVPTEDALLFAGKMDAAPNVEAVRNFCQHILPRIVRDVPGAKLHIIGTYTEAVSDLASESVVVHGSEDDPLPGFHRASAVVVPMLRGGGTRQKVLMAAACGKAIVSTPLGVEGLDLRPGEDYLEADLGPGFAAAVVQILRNEPLRRRLERNALQVARRRDWEGIGSLYCQIVENLAAKPRRLAESAREMAQDGAGDPGLPDVPCFPAQTT